VAAVKKKNDGPSSTRIIRSLIIVIAVSVILGLVAKGAMDALNRKMGIDPEASSTVADTTGEEEVFEVVEMPQYDPVESLESGSSIWVPDWKPSPCSIFLSGGADAIADSLPEAPGPSDRATELQLLIELWAVHADYSTSDIERVWAFSSGDTCFIDLPYSPDWEGIAETIESRFISYSRMFPYVAGEMVSGTEDGISLRGIPSN